MDSLESVLAGIRWSEAPVQLQDLRDEKLPLVVRLSDPGTDLGPGVDGSRPLLVYSRRRRTKVYAECLGLGDGGKSIQAYGPVYEIPKDYTGWFEVFPASGTPPQPEPNLEKLVSMKQILVRTMLHVFPYTNNDIQMEEELKLYPGEVLTVDRVIQKQWKTKNSDSASGPSTRFLKCRDFSERDVCIPLAHPGIFNPVYDPELGASKNPENAVYQIANLVECKFPIVVKLAFGWPPQGDAFQPQGSDTPSHPPPPSFCGVLQLVGVRRPDTMVLCSMAPGKTQLLEIPLDMDLKLVRAAEKLEALEKHPAYVTLLKKCYAKVYQFVISIRAMVVKYPLLKPEEGRTYKRYSIPIDMDQFNPLDVYPPLEEDEQPGYSFQLSFRDPDERSTSAFMDGLSDQEYLDPHIASGLLGGPHTTEAVRSNLHHMRRQYNKQREERESIA